MASHNELPIAVTMGEPAGVGGEILLKAVATRSPQLPPLVAVDDIERLRSIAEDLQLGTELVEYKPGETRFPLGHNHLAVRHSPLEAPQMPGILNKANAPTVIASIRHAVDLVKSGDARAVVTNPIQKSALYEAGFTFPGHTEFLASMSHTGTTPVMMLACDQLRVIPVTIHVSLKEALRSLTPEKIVELTLITAQALKTDFGIASPRLAIAGLNPHAGENGSMGDEEQVTILPAIETLRQRGLDVSGPYSPDTLFSAFNRETYDVAICMYHDQALIPIKTLDFDGGVNITLGLDFVRTSPDHGTALDIAGSGKASERSLVAAIRMADQMAAHRATCERMANA